MLTKDNKYLFHKLRNEFEVFTFRSFDYCIEDQTLKIQFNFDIADRYFFNPKVYIPENKHIRWKDIDISSLESLVFNMGMIELVSYWKATCSPVIKVMPGGLNSEQKRFWQKLYFNGLGEFYFLNGIETTMETAFSFSVSGNNSPTLQYEPDNNCVIVPVGGGKDSVVTLELLKQGSFKVIPMMVNPREASWRTIDIAGFKRDDCLIINRDIDRRLLELNSQGFLNGHTPFSAMLAFTSVITAYVTNSAHVALSNESSANQSTVPGSKINHQYSKSFEFESDFHNYSSEFLLKGYNYFSFLRPVSELQIAKLFSGYKYHHPSFRSCNIGSKTDSWCGACAKCLFTYIILSPFITNDELKLIFGKDLMADRSLTPIFNELTGITPVKPFECVGTTEEVIAAFTKAFSDSNVPINDSVFDATISFKSLLNDYNNENLLKPEFSHLLKTALHG